VTMMSAPMLPPFLMCGGRIFFGALGFGCLLMGVEVRVVNVAKYPLLVGSPTKSYWALGAGAPPGAGSANSRHSRSTCRDTGLPKFSRLCTERVVVRTSSTDGSGAMSQPSRRYGVYRRRRVRGESTDFLMCLRPTAGFGVERNRRPDSVAGCRHSIRRTQLIASVGAGGPGQ
jgi:hypothetical protein